MSVITKSYSTDGSSADLTGEVTDLHGESSLECYFQWGTDTSYGNVTPAQTISSLTTFSDTITGLNIGGTYHFRSVATDGTNYWYGNDVEFTTGFVLDEQFSQEQVDFKVASHFVDHFAYPQIDSQDGFHLQSSTVDPLIIGSLIKDYLTSEFFLDQKFLHGSAVINFTDDTYTPPEAQTIKVDIAEDPGIYFTVNSMIGQFNRPGLSSWTYYSDPYRYTLDVSTQIFGAYPFEATMNATLCKLDETFHPGYYSISMPIYRIPDGYFTNVDFAGHLYHCYWFDTSFVQEQYEIITGPRLDTSFPDIVYDFRFRGYLYATFTDVDYTFYFSPRFDSAFQKYELFNTFGLQTDYIFPVPDYYLTMCMRMDLLNEFTKHTLFGAGASILLSRMFTIFQHLELDVEGSMTYMKLIEQFLYPEEVELEAGQTAFILDAKFSYHSSLFDFQGALELDGKMSVKADMDKDFHSAELVSNTGNLVNTEFSKLQISAKEKLFYRLNTNFNNSTLQSIIANKLNSEFLKSELDSTSVKIIKLNECFNTEDVNILSGAKIDVELADSLLFALELIEEMQFADMNISAKMTQSRYAEDILNYEDREPQSRSGILDTSTDDNILSYDGAV